MSDDDICIAGIGETPPSRRSPRTVKANTLSAALAAIEDAGIEPGEVDGIVTDSLIMPPVVPHDWMGAQLGTTRYFDASISYGGAGTVAAPLLARMALREGLARYVLVYFGIDWGSGGGPYRFHDMYPAKVAFEKPYGFEGQPVYFAMIARLYMSQYSVAPEGLGALATMQRRNAILTGRAQNARPLTIEDYLAAPMVADPLRVPDCCLISDGAVAFVLTTRERARKTPSQPVLVRGVGFASAPVSAESAFTQNPELLELPGASLAGAAAEREAGLSLQSCDFAEIYDCFTISCLMQLEDLGLCGRGEAAAFVADGRAELGGEISVNTHGGLLSYSYRLGAEHVFEAVRQLRHEAGANQVPNAKRGLVTGLSHPDFAVLVLERT